MGYCGSRLSGPAYLPTSPIQVGPCTSSYRLADTNTRPSVYLPGQYSDILGRAARTGRLGLGATV